MRCRIAGCRVAAHVDRGFRLPERTHRSGASAQFVLDGSAARRIQAETDRSSARAALLTSSSSSGGKRTGTGVLSRSLPPTRRALGLLVGCVGIEVVFLLRAHGFRRHDGPYGRSRPTLTRRRSTRWGGTSTGRPNEMAPAPPWAPLRSPRPSSAPPSASVAKPRSSASPHRRRP